MGWRQWHDSESGLQHHIDLSSNPGPAVYCCFAWTISKSTIPLCANGDNYGIYYVGLSWGLNEMMNDECAAHGTVPATEHRAQ